MIAPAIASSVRRMAVALAAACALLPLVHTTSAYAATPLPALQSDGYIIPDAADHHVFVSGRPSSLANWNAPLYVMNEDGTLDTTVDVPGASGMALDGGVLYVLQCFSDQITTVDPATLTVTGTIPLGEASAEPCDLALAGGRLWFPAGADSHLASVPVAAPHARVDTGIAVSDGLVSHPGSNVLVVFDTGTAISMDASTATPTQIAFRNFGTTWNAAMSPDGSLVTAAVNLPVMSMPGLSDVPGFPQTGYAAAISDDNAWMATGDANLRVTAKGADAPLNTYPIRPRALAFAPDGSRLYVLVNSDSGPLFESIVAPTLPRPQLTLARSPRTSTAGRTVTLTATLSVADPSGVVQIWRQSTTGTLTLVGQGAVGADRKFAAVVRPKVYAVYVATFVPDATYGPATSPVTRLKVRSRVTVKATGWYARRSSYHLYHYRASCRLHGRGCPTFTATVLPNYAGKRVTFELQLHVGGHWRSVGTVRSRLGRRSMATLHIGYRSSAVIGISARIRAVMPQQPTNLLGASAWSHFRVTA
jgi:YVTN family beta-propeller protein